MREGVDSGVHKGVGGWRHRVVSRRDTVDRRICVRRLLINLLR
jgi:hypothetical protein